MGTVSNNSLVYMHAIQYSIYDEGLGKIHGNWWGKGEGSIKRVDMK